MDLGAAGDRDELEPPDARAEALERLAAWPRARSVVHELSPCGVVQLENAVGTRLMALYRDTRSQEAFAALYSFSRDSVLRWIRSLLRRDLARLDPLELLQDTFINVFSYPGGFRDDHEGSYRVWVRTIAGNVLRRAARRPRALAQQELIECVEEPVDEGVNPVLQALAREQAELLRESWILFLAHYARAWEQLSERDRRALELVEVRGLSYAAAAVLLGVKRSNMKMIVFRARKRIAARIRLDMRPAPMVLRQAG